MKSRGLGSLCAGIVILVLAFAFPASAADRDYLLQWINSPSPDVAGYKVYVGETSRSYGPGKDIAKPADSQYLLQGLDASRNHYVALTAYNFDGLESGFSNEIVIEALACDPTACNDGNPCTLDSCSGSVCINAPVRNGTGCDDGDSCTVGEVCSAGVCGGGSLPVGDSSYELDIDAAMHPLLDLSGGYTGVDVLGFLIDYDLAMDGRGRVTGSGVATHPLVSAPVPVMVYGSMRSKRGRTYITLIFRLRDPDARGALIQRFAIDAGAGTYSLVSFAKARVAGQRIKDRQSDSSLPLSALPWPLDGTWTLFVDVINLNGSRLESSATAQLSSGAEIDFTGRGRLKNGVGHVSLRSPDRASMSFALDSVGITDAGIRYQALGQAGTATHWTETVLDTCEE